MVRLYFCSSRRHTRTADALDGFQSALETWARGWAPEERVSGPAAAGAGPVWTPPRGRRAGPPSAPRLPAEGPGGLAPALPPLAALCPGARPPSGRELAGPTQAPGPSAWALGLGQALAPLASPKGSRLPATRPVWPKGTARGGGGTWSRGRRPECGRGVPGPPCGSAVLPRVSVATLDMDAVVLAGVAPRGPVTRARPCFLGLQRGTGLHVA